MKIFISYTTRDGFVTKNRLVELCYHLSEYGSTFVDIIHNDSIDTQLRVETELLSADLVVFLKTKAFNSSEWALKEQELALLNKIAAVSVDVDSHDNWEESILAVKNVISNKASSIKCRSAAAYNIKKQVIIIH